MGLVGVNVWPLGYPLSGLPVGFTLYQKRSPLFIFGSFVAARLTLCNDD